MSGHVVSKVHILSTIDGYVISEDNTNEIFSDEYGKPRTYKSPSGAIAFLRRACERFSSLSYQIEMPDKKIRFIGNVEDILSENDFGPHTWDKRNLTTIMERGGRSYDMYRCSHCGKEEKAYGLSGHLRHTGVCPKNPIAK